jgi:mannose-6-phosphate isomerase-like protein (cupin superfamily)
MAEKLCEKSTTPLPGIRFPGILAIAFGLGCALHAAESRVDIYSSKQLAGMARTLLEKQERFSGKDLATYSNHYTMLAVRKATGSAELHEHEADVFVVESGQATLLTGGKIVNPQKQKEGEIRGTSIEGGERQQIGAGDIVHIPAGMPHQLLVDQGQPFVYFVLKVTGQ